jgi:protein O-mannosyl-transferase
VPTVSWPWQRAVPPAIAVATFAAFAATAQFDFVDFDDPRLLVNNPHFRGLGWAQLRWMATATLMGLWMPVTWLTYGLDYVLWGMRPAGYHLSNAVLHAVNAAVFSLVARRLLAQAQPGMPALPLALGAAFAGLAFGIHPLRAESVAWITERRDSVSGLFFLLTLLSYLRMVEASAQMRRRWKRVALACFALALGAKAIVMTLPVVLLLLDVYPLRRPLQRGLLVEKAPFFVLTAISAVVTIVAMRTDAEFTSIAAIPVGTRMLVVLHAFGFYASRLLVPLDLAPFYELPLAMGLHDPRFAISAGAVLATTAVLVGLRRRCPAALAAWLAYLVLLLPVCGVLQQGAQLVADRYSYLSSMPLTLLAAGGLARATAVAPRARMLALGAAGLWLAGIALLTVQQCAIWRDSGTLWAHAAEVDPTCAVCLNQLGADYARRGLIAPAVTYLDRAVQLRPADALFRTRLGVMRFSAGQRAEGLEDLLQATRIDPRNAEAASNLGVGLTRTGRVAEAVSPLERAVQLDPLTPEFRVHLVHAYLALDRRQEAHPHIDAIRRVNPGLADQLTGASR